MWSKTSQQKSTRVVKESSSRKKIESILSSSHKLFRTINPSDSTHNSKVIASCCNDTAKISLIKPNKTDNTQLTIAYAVGTSQAINATLL
mmetsp:Transcript_119983/g.219683  ORF Transcript_119983/g.219683 Transcript_119983/m.219683 type:complete len:90 (-) Transcript_119983:2-271(-)